MPTRPPAELTVTTEVGAGGARVARVDDERVRAVFAAIGLPDPPRLDRSDPVPVLAIMDRARRWADQRDTAALGELGQIYQGLEEHRAALACFAALVALDEASPRWPYFLGVEAQALGLEEAALDALQVAAAQEPDFGLTHARLGLLHLERGELDQAEASYRRCAELSPGPSLAWVGLGRVALARGEDEQAREFLETAVQKSPSDFLAYRVLAQALGRLGRVAEAEAAQRRSEMLPHYSGWLTFDLRLQHAHALANTQRYLENEIRRASAARDWPAVARLAQALLQRRPDDHAMLANLAGAYRALGRLDDARAAIDRGLTVKPDAAPLYVVRAEIGFMQQDLATASADLERALHLDPGEARAYELRGRIAALRGDLAAAAADLERVVALQPQALTARVVLAEVYRLSGRVDEALQAVDAVLAIDPANAMALSLKQKLDGGE